MILLLLFTTCALALPQVTPRIALNEMIHNGALQFPLGMGCLPAFLFNVTDFAQVVKTSRQTGRDRQIPSMYEKRGKAMLDRYIDNFMDSQGGAGSPWIYAPLF